MVQADFGQAWSPQPDTSSAMAAFAVKRRNSLHFLLHTDGPG